jgi:5,10-methylenetetrahydromethanopterin reductase
MSRLRFGIATMCTSVPAYVEWASVAEAAGYELLGYGDSQNILPEAFVTMAAMADATERVRLCTTVSNPSTRHPSVAASGFGALQQLSGGRAVFGIGTGDSALANVGLRRGRVDELAEYCRAFLDLVRGEEATFRGTTMRFRWDCPAVPLFIAAEGPRVMQLAGELADGVIFGNGISDDVVRDNIERVTAAAATAGRDSTAVEPWFMTKLIISDRPEPEVWRDYAWTLAASANHAFRFTLAGKFVPEALEAPLRGLMAGYRSMEHNQVAAGEHNGALVNDNGLTEFLGARYLIAGTPEHIAERLVALEDAGVRNILVSSMWGDPMGETRSLADDVLSRL